MTRPNIICYNIGAKNEYQSIHFCLETKVLPFAWPDFIIDNDNQENDISRIIKQKRQIHFGDNVNKCA